MKSVSKVLKGQMERWQYLVSRRVGIRTKERSTAASETRGEWNQGAERAQETTIFHVFFVLFDILN